MPICLHASKQGLYTKFRTSKTSASLQKRFKTNIETFEHQIAEAKGITDSQFYSISDSIEALLYKPPFYKYNNTVIDNMTFHFSYPASYATRSKRAIPFVIGAAVGTAAASLDADQDPLLRSQPSAT